MDTHAIRVTTLMADACELIEGISRGKAFNADLRAELDEVRGALMRSADLTDDLEAADAAWGMAQAIDAVSARASAAAASAA